MDSSRKYVQILGSIAANLNMITSGFLNSKSSYMVPQLLKGEGGLRLSEEESSWFASILMLGSIPGALLGSYLCDKVGRRTCLLINSVGFLVGFLLMAFSPSFYLLLLGRFITGIFCGMDLVATPIFVGETSQPSVRGFTGSLLILIYCSGFTVSMLLGALFPWRTVLYIGCTPPILSFSLLLFFKETPTWFLKKGRVDEAYNALFFYRGNEFIVREELERIKENLRRIEKQNEACGSSTIQQLKNKFSRMSESSFLKPFLLIFLMLNGLEFGGFPALAFYMHSILEALESPINPFWMAVILSAYRTIIVFGMSFLLVKIPRRSMYLFSASLVAVALVIQAAFAWFGDMLDPEIQHITRWVPLLAIILQYTGFGLGFGAIVYMMQGELLPSDMRSFGCGLLGCLDNICLFMSVKLVPVLISGLGVGGMYFFYCCFVLFVATVCFFTMPETKGLSLEDIEDYYTSMKHQQDLKKINNKLGNCQGP